MRTLLIVYHSLTGGTRQMAAAAAAAAKMEDAAVHLMPAVEVRADHVLTADGYIFATPENLAAMAGMMKDFFDRTYYAALGRIAGRAYGTLICAGSDGENAARQVARIAAGWRLRVVADPIIVCTRAQTPAAILAPKVIAPEQLDRCRELGKLLAAGLAIGVF